jgi:hypothetical protein
MARIVSARVRHGKGSHGTGATRNAAPGVLFSWTLASLGMAPACQGGRATARGLHVRTNTAMTELHKRKRPFTQATQWDDRGGTRRT